MDWNYAHMRWLVNVYLVQTLIEFTHYIIKNTEWIRHGIMLFWFKDWMNITEKLQSIDPVT